MLNGRLKTYENTSMSLSCAGEITLANGIVTNVSYKGMPRANYVDAWLDFYKRCTVGAEISADTIDRMLEYNGKHNIVSVFIPSDAV